MKVSYISNYKKFTDENIVLALGYFDGFHIGHKALLKKALSLSEEFKVPSGLLTFNESVKEYLKGEEPEYLTTVNEKIDLAESMGFDSIYIIELTDEFVKLSRDEFIDFFLKNMKAVVVGFDYTFGDKGLGNVEYLKDVLKDKVYVQEKIEESSEKIGTSHIKEALITGNLERANSLLGRNYKIEGSIYRKNKNFAISTNNFIPKSGYYLVNISGQGMNITLEAKLKNKSTDKEMVIKTDNEEFNSTRFLKHNRFFITFLSRLTEPDE